GDYGPPWLLYRLFVQPDSSRAGVAIWTVYVHPSGDYPTLVEQLDASGRVRSRYWNDGYIETIEFFRWRGRPVVVLAGTNNETRGGRLAIFGDDRPSGGAPSADEAKRCLSCASTNAIAVLNFPRSCIAEAFKGTATVWRVSAQAD